MKIKIISESERETQKIASFFTESILRQGNLKDQEALVVSLEGPLGSGKTEFLKGVAKFLKLKERIFSPTFLIMKSFPFFLPKPFVQKKDFKTLWHLDCYRLEKIKDIKDLGFSEVIEDPQNLIFVEWGNNIKKILPKNHFTIKFEIVGNEGRILEFNIPEKFN
jgi:tRNA threonylcarbamoyladenosine biosynthesis protein TsaE